MNPKTLLSAMTAVSAVVLNIAFATPAQAQVKAALTRDVDRATAQPAYGNCSGSWSVKCVLYVVPAGKRLVVETVTYKVQSSALSALPTDILFGQVPSGYSYFYPTPSTPNIYFVTPVLTLAAANGLRIWSASQALQVYLDENQTFAAQAEPSVFNVVGSMNFGFSGYLVDK